MTKDAFSFCRVKLATDQETRRIGVLQQLPLEFKRWVYTEVHWVNQSTRAGTI